MPAIELFCKISVERAHVCEVFRSFDIRAASQLKKYVFFSEKPINIYFEMWIRVFLWIIGSIKLLHILQNSRKIRRKDQELKT